MHLFKIVLQSIFGCLVDHRLRNIHLNICGACQGDCREFHSAFSVILLGFCFYWNDKKATEQNSLLVNFFSCLLTYLVTHACTYGNMKIKWTIECLTRSLTFSLLMVEQKQQSPNLPNECKSNDHQLSFREYRLSGMTTWSFAVFAGVPKLSWFYKLACSNSTGT